LSNRLVLIGGFVVQAASFWVFALLPSAPILLGSIAINALCSEPINPLVVSLLQERAPAGMRGRVIGTFSAIAIGTLPIGTMLGGFLLNGFGLVPTLVIIATAASALALSLFAIPAFRTGTELTMASR
jgi:MFS family permease